LSVLKTCLLRALDHSGEKERKETKYVRTLGKDLK